MTPPKNAELWLASYGRIRLNRLISDRPAKRLWLAITDHFEPMGGEVSLEMGLARMSVWQRQWPRVVSQCPRDSAGNLPCFTAFYPQEEYRPEVLDILAELAHSQSYPGSFDVEVHLHHDNDTAEGFVAKMEEFLERLDRGHGLLHWHAGRLVFGFIHGNWALDNSRPDGRWCGVTGELHLLRDLGCYADFTMPSLPSPTQSRIINQIYWTTGDPAQPRGFDQGVEATIDGGRQGDLLMITGPVGIRYRDRLIPRLETGELSCYDPPTPYRVKRWIDLAPRVGDDIFLKLYGHTAREDNAAALLGTENQPGSFESMFRWIHQEASRRNLELHWVSAFNMYRAVENLMQPSAVLPSVAAGAAS